jgi:low affinity Fe/Cu permease
MPDRTVERREGDGPLDPLIFASFARWVEQQLGRSTAFVLAILGVGLWAVTGPFFGWSDTWQLVINTGTTIVTFLMVFVIQNTQNRDTKALQLKLNELIRVNKAARNSLMSLEEKSEPEVEEIKSAFVELASTGKSIGEGTAPSRRGGPASAEPQNPP